MLYATWLGRGMKGVSLFAGKVMMSCNGNWFTLLLLCTSAPLVLYCDRFDYGSSQVKLEPIALVMEDYDVSLCQRIEPGTLSRQE